MDGGSQAAFPPRLIYEVGIGRLMEPFESHSFILKVWLEESLEDAEEAVWRGHVTHVPSQERRYLQTLDDIIDFVGPYLEQMGVRPRGYRRLRRADVRGRFIRSSIKFT